MAMQYTKHVEHILLKHIRNIYTGDFYVDMWMLEKVVTECILELVFFGFRFYNMFCVFEVLYKTTLRCLSDWFKIWLCRLF